MNTIAERSYAAAPVWLQHVMISAYGARLRRTRYGGEQQQHLARIRDTAWLPLAEQRRRQLAALNRVLQQARRNVPFYASRIPRSPLTRVEEIRAIPLLTKRDVLAARSAMHSQDLPFASLLSVHTGGTTGTPLTVACDRSALRRNYAFFARFLEWTGVPSHPHVATFAGRVIVPPGHDRSPYWRYNVPGNAMLCSSYHLGPDTYEEYAGALARYAPALIDAYPSAIAPLARYLLRTGDTRIRPRAVVTSSETLSAEDAADIARAFDCQVFDHYGAAEMAALITQCREGSYHVNADYGVVELLDGDRPVEIGEEGDIVATGFINPVMPFIRYVTGDRAVRGPETACACGSSFPRIERICGRADDVIVTPEGYHVGRLDPIFKTVHGLDETRIVQDAADHLRIEVVCSGELSIRELGMLMDNLRQRVGPAMQLEVVRLPKLERSASGKLRSVVNLTAARSENRPATPAGSLANLG